MDVFLSHSSADKKLAERLARDLETHGLSVWLDRRELTPGSHWQHEIEEALRKAEHILLLIGRREPDEAQQLTWRLALEAVWQDPEKRFVPVLHHGADLPAFVVSGSSRDTAIPVVRIEDGRNLRDTVDTIVDVVKGEPTQKAVFERGEDEVKVKAAERSHRLLDIRRYALSLKRATGAIQHALGARNRNGAAFHDDQEGPEARLASPGSRRASIPQVRLRFSGLRSTPVRRNTRINRTEDSVVAGDSARRCQHAYAEGSSRCVAGVSEGEITSSE